MGRARGASSLWQAGRAGWGSTRDKRNLRCRSREGRKGVPPKVSTRGVIWSPRAGIADFRSHIIFVLWGTVKVLLPSFALHLRAEKLSKGMITDLVDSVQKPPPRCRKNFLDSSPESCFKSHTKTIAVHNTPLMAHWCNQMPCYIFW